MRGNVTIQEEWVEWDEGRSFTYLGSNIPMIKTARNTWTVKPMKGQTLLTTESEVEIKGGFLGKVLEPLMRHMSKRMGADSLAALKYLVETGHPYKRKHSNLPRVPSTC